MRESYYYFKVLAPAAGHFFSLTPGELGSVPLPAPPTILAFAKSGVVEELPSAPAAGFTIRKFDSGTFTREPAERAIERPVTREAILEHLGWSIDDMRVMQAHSNFPRPAAWREMRTMEKLDAKDEPMWLLSSVQQWVREYAPIVDRFSRAVLNTGIGTP